jgi:hypothetical protein
VNGHEIRIDRFCVAALCWFCWNGHSIAARRPEGQVQGSKSKKPVNHDCLSSLFANDRIIEPQAGISSKDIFVNGFVIWEVTKKSKMGYA